MNCSNELHNGFISNNIIICPFCYLQIQSVDKHNGLRCCIDMNVETIAGMLACISCGIVHDCTYSIEYIDFHENKYKLKRKSIYNRKYHIKNTIDHMTQKHDFHLSYDDQRAIDTTLKKISRALTCNGRKRSIKMTYIFHRVLDSIGSENTHEFRLPKNKKTLKLYDQIWKDICEKTGLE